MLVVDWFLAMHYCGTSLNRCSGLAQLSISVEVIALLHERVHARTYAYIVYVNKNVPAIALQNSGSSLVNILYERENMKRASYPLPRHSSPLPLHSSILHRRYDSDDKP